MDRPYTKATLNKPISNNALDTSCTKTNSTPRAGGLAKPGHAASLFDYPFNGLQPRFGVCRTIRQNGASTMRPGKIHDEDVEVVVSCRI